MKPTQLTIHLTEPARTALERLRRRKQAEAPERLVTFREIVNSLILEADRNWNPMRAQEGRQ